MGWLPSTRANYWPQRLAACSPRMHLPPPSMHADRRPPPATRLTVLGSPMPTCCSSRGGITARRGRKLAHLQADVGLEGGYPDPAASHARTSTPSLCRRRCSRDHPHRAHDGSTSIHTAQRPRHLALLKTETRIRGLGVHDTLGALATRDLTATSTHWLAGGSYCQSPAPARFGRRRYTLDTTSFETRV
ncbi:hypothetical protein B0H19DRAFT_1096588 [Mycena capillaripes]|nr:hypothetical protein B0H19DRAFT_1096588 [Mycena capillaripes]